MHHQLDGHARAATAVAHPVGDLVGRINRIEDQVHVGTGIGQADGRFGVRNHLLHHAETAVHEIGAQQNGKALAVS